MHPVTDYHATARISTRFVGREQPGPSPAELVFRVLPSQAVGQYHRHPVLSVTFPGQSSLLHLARQFGNLAQGDGDDSVIATFSAASAEAAAFQVISLIRRFKGSLTRNPRCAGSDFSRGWSMNEANDSQQTPTNPSPSQYS
jgi:hypothetical protein